MAHIFWTADLNTGFSEIDKQHQQMVLYINELNDAFEKSGASREDIGKVLFDLISCSMNHFDYEETMMERSGYALTEPHRRVHQNFANKLMEYQGRLLAGEDIKDELLNSLDGWLFRHIRLNDRGYIDSVQAAGLYNDEDFAAAIPDAPQPSNWQPESAAAPSTEETSDQRMVFTDIRETTPPAAETPAEAPRSAGGWASADFA